MTLMALRSWLRRRPLRRLGPDDETGVSRGVRTCDAAELGTDRVWPVWMERQLDPRSRAFVAGGELPVLANVTGRNWTGIGNVASPVRAIVDPRGLVTPWRDGWSLDWWIGAEDRWHLPSREPAVRQSLVGTSPVVETIMRVPGGDAVARAFAIVAGEGLGDLVVVEVENRSAVPFAVAFAVRPYNPEGVGVLERIELHDDRVVTVDGRPALLLPRAPSGAVGSSFVDGDVFARVEANQLDLKLTPVRCPSGLAQAAFVFALSHASSLRVAMPLAAGERAGRPAAARRARGVAPLPTPLPGAPSVARAWEAQCRRGMRLVLPPGRLADAVEANRKCLLLSFGGEEVAPGPFTSHRFRFGDAADLLGALDRCGFHAEAADALVGYPERQRFDGYFDSGEEGWGTNGAAIHAVATHWRLTRDADVLDRTLPAVALGARWIEQARTGGRRGRRRRDPRFDGLLPKGVSASPQGPFDHHYADDFWSLRGLLDAAELLRAGGEHHGAGRCEELAAGLRADLERSLELAAERLGSAIIPAGPDRPVDPAIIASLVACQPLGLLAADHPGVVATIRAVQDRFCLGPAVFQPVGQVGLSPRLTLQLAAVELAQGDRRALDRLRWMVEAATATFNWPEAIHPALGNGCGGDGHHHTAGAGLVNLVRSMLVREDGEDADGAVVLRLCSLLPDEWQGQGIEVHHAPTEAGRLSFAVRWHGPRPALLWDLRPHDGVDRVRLSAPGLDPTWSTAELTGEALLGPHRERTTARPTSSAAATPPTAAGPPPARSR